MTAGQAGALAVGFFFAFLLVLFLADPFGAIGRYLQPLLTLLLGAAVLAGLLCACMILFGCPKPKPELAPTPNFRLLDPCPGGKPDPSQEFGCAPADSVK